VQNCGQVPFGCNLISNSAWKGVRLSDILALAGGLQPGVQSIAVYSADEYVGSIPNDPALHKETLLAYEMNGQVLPYEHGYPARLLTPGRYGMKSPKWVIAIRPMKSILVDWFGQRGWNHDAIVRTMTRIDVPSNGQTLTAGPQRIGGIAYAGSRGIARVDFSTDGGKSWQKASIIDKPSGIDQWVQWQGTFTMPASGTVDLTARSVDGTGTSQIAAYNPTQPDGATGLMSIQVKAGRA
ncbi:MAG TPA: molybdopterin-dependent oxidoreductase, partial [Chloroflexota bacterium]|nr:molybdopterin-dependent oxidoreductase [Chloroflexota bacterium]